MRRSAAIVAWILLASIFAFTDGPLSLRPTTGLSPNTERFVALAVVGFAFALAYPHRPALFLAFLLAAVGSLEILQYLVRGRHGTVHDAAIKCVGVITGIAAGHIFSRLLACRR